MPPSASVVLTTTPASTTPTQYGASLTTPSTSPAVRNCGTRYRKPITSTTTAESLRSPAEASRASAKSGTVSAPDRRIGAATSTSIATYPAVNPTGYHSAPMPSLTTSPATPRKDAADRYSPDTAAALSSGDTFLEATRKSDVERIAITPRTPISTVASTTGSTVRTAITPAPPPRPCAVASGPAEQGPGMAARPASATTAGCRPAVSRPASATPPA